MLPVVSVQALLEMARCYLTLGDPAGAAAVLRKSRTSSSDGQSSASCRSGLPSCEPGSARSQAGAVGASALTAAELRLLPLLATHLSFPQIAAELFLSPHTIKSEMKSIYRKLGATTRTGAVTRSRELGLLEG